MPSSARCVPGALCVRLSGRAHPPPPPASAPGLGLFQDLLTSTAEFNIHEYMDHVWNFDNVAPFTPMQLTCVPAGTAPSPRARWCNECRGSRCQPLAVCAPAPARWRRRRLLERLAQLVMAGPPHDTESEQDIASEDSLSTHSSDFSDVTTEEGSSQYSEGSTTQGDYTTTQGGTTTIAGSTRRPTTDGGSSVGGSTTQGFTTTRSRGGSTTRGGSTVRGGSATARSASTMG